jgi:hypothetical protein
MIATHNNNEKEQSFLKTIKETINRSIIKEMKTTNTENKNNNKDCM